MALSVGWRAAQRVAPAIVQRTVDFSGREFKTAMTALNQGRITLPLLQTLSLGLLSRNIVLTIMDESIADSTPGDLSAALEMTFSLSTGSDIPLGGLLAPNNCQLAKFCGLLRDVGESGLEGFRLSTLPRENKMMQGLALETLLS